MCDFCLKHGANGKWFDNAKNYLKETYDEANSYEYLEDLWGNLERGNIRKAYGIATMKWASTQINKPIVGSLVKWYANRGFQLDGRKHKRLQMATAQGHFGQILTLDEARTILTKKAPIVVKAYCPCKYFMRGIKEATCLGFSALNEVLPKLPRFIPEHGVEIMDADKVDKFLNEMSKKGRINTIYCGPVPAIAALCSCDVMSCAALDLRKYGIRGACKSHSVAVVVRDNCIQCGKCETRCQFHVLKYDPNNGPSIKLEECFGCGKCSEVCEQHAIKLEYRIKFPQLRKNW